MTMTLNVLTETRYKINTESTGSQSNIYKISLDGFNDILF